MDQGQDHKGLIRQISIGDEQAFEELFSLYFRYLHNVAYNRLQSEQAADDIVQDIFTDLWKNRENLAIHTSVKSYLFQAAKHKVYKHIRHQSVREKENYIRRIHDDYYSQNPFPQSHKVVERDELKEKISTHLDDLPDKSRNIFHLSRDKQYTHKEIAEQLNCSPKTVEYHIGKALQHLRLHLKDYVAILIPLYLFL
jgi:RNA polymerase sigma-70 factor, ECF subfamily